MPDFRVKFVGDLGNLANFDAAIRNSANQNVKALEQANRNVASRVAPSAGAFNPRTSGGGFFTSNAKVTVDAFNRTMIQSGDVLRRTLVDYEAVQNAAGKFKLKPIFDTQYDSSFKQIIGDLDAYEAAQKRIAPVEQRILEGREATLKRTIPLMDQIAQKQLRIAAPKGSFKGGDIFRAGQERVNLAEINLLGAQNKVRSLLDSVAKGGTVSAAEMNKATRSVTKFQNELNTATNRSVKDINRVENAIAALQARINRLNGTQAGRATRLRNAEPGYADLTAAANATPPINRNLQNVLRDSRELQNRLLREGLGTTATGARTQIGTTDFQKTLADQEAAVSRYTRNLRTGVRTVQGSFRDLKTGLLNEFTIDIDKNGKVVERWGGQLSGAGNILRQTVRDFQKVIEWTVATTLVFGTLAAVVAQLKNINELNTLLARLSITAQASAEQTNALFDGLGQVAIQTATPLNEIASAADDIALATRNANQSTEEWHANILELTRAVGIYTNLAGIDTVEATDQLSAAFKQLGIAPSEVIGILNKITAVAGGQAEAIKDIVGGVAGLAESARAAGLTVDEQIASIQVLSQVTNKTSSEITTSFKNLFGSVSSVGSEKILKEFGIQIRDSEGGIRDFLDIYRDVKDALDKGIIPQNRLPDILRGISGGPRRAPDAAALLSNLGRIDEVVAKSQNATNEALIANAKILDTNTAKITQFQNAISITIFEKFGKAITDLVSTLVGFGTTVAEVLNSVDANVFKVIIQLGALYTAAKIAGGLAKLMGIENLLTSLGRLTTGFKTTTAAAAGLTAVATGPGTVIPLGAPAGPGGVKGILANLNQNKGRVAALGAAAGIGVGAAIAGGLNTNSIGAGLQLGGSLITLIPGLQAVGIAALAAGTLIQVMAGDSEKAKESEHDLAIEIHTLTESLQASQEAANGFMEAQKKAKSVIDELQDKTGKTADEQTRLSAATEEYVTATLGLANANQQVADSFDLILQKLPGLYDKYSAFKNLVTSGGLSPAEIKDIQQQLAREILQGTGQAIFSSETPAQFNAEYFRNARRAPGGDTARLAAGLNGGQAAGQQFSFEALRTDPTLLKNLFSIKNGQAIPRAPIEAFDQVNLSTVQSALSQLPELIAQGKAGGITEADFKAMIAAIQRLTTSFDSFNANAVANAQLRADTQANLALGIFTQEQGQGANLSADLIERLNLGANKYVAQQPYPGRDEARTIPKEVLEAQKLITTLGEQASKGIAPTIGQLLQASRYAILFNKDLQALGETGQEVLNEAMFQYLESLNLSAEQLDELAKLLGRDLANAGEQVVDISAQLETARQNAARTFAERSLQLEIGQNSGDYKNNSKGLKILQDQNKQALVSNNALIDSVGSLSTIMQSDLNNALSNVIGLQGQYITNSQLAALGDGDAAKAAEEMTAQITGMTQQLIDNAIAAGVNAEGIKKIEEEVAILIGLIAAVPSYKKVLIEVETRINNATTNNLSESEQIRLEKEYKRLADRQKVADDAAKANKKAQEDAAKAITDIIRQGIGNRLGAGPSTSTSKGAGLDVSTLDIPDVLKDLNQKGLLSDKQLAADVQQAYKNAARLQKQIPGFDKEAANDIVAILEGTKKLAEFRGVKEELLRKALEELADIEKKRLDFETKADTIRRIRVGAGDFAAFANVPLNTKTGVSVGGPEGPITINLGISGQVLTPAQFSQLADQIAAAIKRQLAG